MSKTVEGLNQIGAANQPEPTPFLRPRTAGQAPVFYVLLVLFLFFSAQNSFAVEPHHDYHKRVDAAQTLTALSDDLMGDSVSLYNGATEFSAVDIDLPGNNAIPVQLRRRFAAEVRPAGTGELTTPPVLGGAGNWDVDVPHISGVFEASYGWAALGLNGTNYNRCSNFAGPSVRGPYQVSDFWQGNTVHIPGESDRPMLLTNEEAPQPNDGVARRWTTRERDMFTCIPMASGMQGEGFVMQTASGLRYTFNVSVQRTAGILSYTFIEGSPGVKVARVKIYLLATKVEDRFGNFVDLAYNGNGHLTSMVSNDGRVISLAYADGRLASASVSDPTAGQRTWQYTYGTVGDNAGRLVSVVNPDASAWQYAYQGNLSPFYEPWDGGSSPLCSPPTEALDANYQITITHPSGAVGNFQLSNRRHWRSGVPLSACIQRQENQSIYFVLTTPHYFDILTLASKEISGPGLAARTWTFGYDTEMQPLWGSRVPTTPTCSTCPEEKVTVVQEPGGVRKEYRYGFLYTVNEGRLLGTRTLDSNGVLHRNESTTYIAESEVVGQNFYPTYGFGISGHDPSTHAVRPVVAQTVEQDGEIYAMSVNQGCGTAQAYCFDVFGSPTSVQKLSSAGATREESTEYYNNTERWILGQVSKASTDGVVTQETTFDAWARPSVLSSFGKVARSFSYYPDGGADQTQWGTVASVSDGRDSAEMDTTILYSNWKRGTPQNVVYPATPDQPSGASVSASVDDFGWIRWLTDENGGRTCYSYDGAGRVTQITYPSETAPNVCDVSAWTPTTASFSKSDSQSTAYGIPGGHWKHLVSTGDARKVTYFDAMWRPLVEETFDAGAPEGTRSIAVKRYDSRGREAFNSYPVRTLTDYASGALAGTATAYDALDRVTSVTQDSELGPLVTANAYIAGGGSLAAHRQTTDAAGHVTKTWFQAFDRPSEDAPILIQHPEGAFTDITRDSLGKPLWIRRRDATNTLAVTRNYVYDAHQQLCKTVEPESGSTIMAYDVANNLVWSAGGQELPSKVSCNTEDVPLAERVSRSYDARGRVMSLAFPDGLGDTSYIYSPDGLVTQMVVDNGGADLVTSDYTYNARRLPTSDRLRSSGNDWTQSYAYSAYGHLAALTNPDGVVVDYAPNALGQPTQAGAYALGVAYHPNGGMSGFTYGNGIIHSVTQNVRQLPEQSVDGSGVLDDTYLYDALGNVDSILDGREGNRGNRSMSYDGLSRLTAVESPMFLTAPLYAYDVLDNLTRVRAPGRDHTYVYDAKWRLQTVSDTAAGTPVSGLSYDERGNLASKDSQSFVFDMGNRLRSASGLETYAYDGHGRRVRATHPSQGSIHSFYGHDGVLRFQRDERLGTTTSYVMLNGSLLARVNASVAPIVPTLSVPAFSNNGSYDVSWSEVAGVTRYELRERAGAGEWQEIYNGAALAMSIIDKVSGTYDYQVRGCRASACGGWSATGSVAVTLPPAVAPTVTAPATAILGNFAVSWTASAGATSYVLEESANGGEWTASYDGPGVTQAFSAKAAGVYNYRVSACNSAGCSGYSASVSVLVVHPPTGVADISVPASSADGIYVVTWTEVLFATSYTLEEQVDGGAWVAFGSNASTSQAISGKPNGTYAYRVEACNPAGCGPASSVVATTVLLPPAGSPAVSVPATDTTGTYSVSWAAVATATSYEIQENLNGGDWVAFATSAELSAIASERVAGSYGYRGRACNASGCSGYSAVSTIAVSRVPASVPALTVPATTSNGSFDISWTAVPDATSYTLEQETPQAPGTWAELTNTTLLSVGASGRTAGVWSYRVKACNAVGCGSTSAVASVTSTAPEPPPVPTGVLMRQVSSLECRVTWDASPGATSYELSWFGSSFSVGSTRTYIHDATCPPDRPSVRACNDVICSAWSP